MSKSELIGQKFEALDHGHVILMDYMGSDQDIVQAARTSYQKGTRPISDDRTLIRYLIRHHHSTPLESAIIKLHVKLPIFVERQWARHRTAGWSEVSARYSELPEETYIPKPEDICYQSKTNKQGGSEQVTEDEATDFIYGCKGVSDLAFGNYKDDLQSDIARETARINLPLSTYTEKVWWMNLHNLLHFLKLRMDSHAQKEIRDYANVIGNEIVRPLFPLVWEAFEDYRLGAVTLSRLDVEMLQCFSYLSRTKAGVESGLFAELCREEPFVSHGWDKERCRERDECRAKLERLGFVF